MKPGTRLILACTVGVVITHVALHFLGVTERAIALDRSLFAVTTALIIWLAVRGEFKDDS